jgi:hypothetical protein
MSSPTVFEFAKTRSSTRQFDEPEKLGSLFISYTIDAFNKRRFNENLPTLAMKKKLASYEQG